MGQEASRFRVYDGALGSGSDSLVGQERAQADIHGFLQSFARSGRADKMVLLHGPNGSGKTTIIECLCRGLEEFSQTPQGVLLKFNWIFQEREGKNDRIGFDRDLVDLSDHRSLADLDEREIGVRIACEMRDPPIFLVPRARRKQLIEEAIESCDLPRRPDFNYEFFADGDLCQKCRRIYDNLLNSYRGDWEKLIRHVQVERYSISKRYRTGAVSIEPQVNVDATVRPFNAEHPGTLPAPLRNVTLFEPVGDIIDANHGVLEYSDFLKRQVETSKYLLTTCEQGTVNLPHFMAYLNLMILGTSNEKQLSLFKRSADFSSFKGRIELVPVPYLLMVSKEVEIYHRHISSFARDRHVTPHTAYIAALWAVLTRLRKPNP
ncbi:MAG: AAA family ATPase, partial [Thermoanaerobaculia bacterium]